MKQKYDLENLGIWDWDAKRFPPYWEQLRRFVFARDGYRCNRCHKFFRDARKLDAHHVIWREHGGSDHPRNLVAVCEPCHDIIHGAKNEHELLEIRQTERPKPYSPGFRISNILLKQIGLSKETIPVFSNRKRIRKIHNEPITTLNPDRGIFFNGHIFELVETMTGVSFYDKKSLCGDFVTNLNLIKVGTPRCETKIVCDKCDEIAIKLNFKVL